MGLSQIDKLKVIRYHKVDEMLLVCKQNMNRVF